MNRTTLLATVALLLVPVPGAAQEPEVRFVVLDQFADIQVAGLGLQACTGASLERDLERQAVHFREEDPAPQQVPVFTPGYATRGCGNVTLEMPIPAGTDHLHVRFLQDRVISLFSVFQEEVSAGIDFEQTVQVALDGAEQPPLTLFPTNSTGAQSTIFEVPAVRPEGAGTLRVRWSMADAGQVFAPGFPTGSSYASTLEGIIVEFSGIPLAANTALRDGSGGDLQVDELRVAATVTARSEEGYRNDLRFRLAPGWEFIHVEAPGGAVLDQAGTRVAAGEVGYDRFKPLREQGQDYVQVTVAEPILTRHGDGQYTLVVRRVSDLDINEAMLPVAVALLLSPLPFALVAYLRTRAYEREAFGSFRRSARYLRLALVGALVYYLVVVGSAFAGSRLALMAVLPLSTEAILLYVQVLVAIAAFMALALVARELYRITQPKPVEP
ncbi:MAG: hypothetical protein QOD77_6 [Thermoplasmata archaeon]|jgi:hypothetical protein|nr:hypothetical protein [Thermoplasmata archaeon]